MLGRFGVGALRVGRKGSFDISEIRPVPCFIWMLFSEKKKIEEKKVGSFVSWIDAVILMLLSGSGGQNQRGREIPSLVFLFLGDYWGMVGTLLSSSLFSQFSGRGVVWAVLPAPACPGMLCPGGWLWGLGGCQEGWWRASLALCQILWHWSHLNKSPLRLFFPIIFLRWCRGRDQIPSEREGSSSALLAGIPLANPTGFPAHAGTGIPAAMGLLFHLGSPNVCRTFHPRLTFLSLSFPSFSPFLSLLSPHLPSAASALTGPRWRSEVSPSASPLEMSVPCGLVLSRDEKVLNAALNGSRWPKTSKKNEQNPFLLCTESSCHCPGHSTWGHTLPGADGCRNPSGEEPSWFLSIPLNCKLRGGEGEIMKFLIKKKNNKSVYIYICGYNLILVPQWGAV